MHIWSRNRDYSTSFRSFVIGFFLVSSFAEKATPFGVVRTIDLTLWHGLSVNIITTAQCTLKIIIGTVGCAARSVSYDCVSIECTNARSFERKKHIVRSVVITITSHAQKCFIRKCRLLDSKLKTSNLIESFWFWACLSSNHTQPFVKRANDVCLSVLRCACIRRAHTKLMHTRSAREHALAWAGLCKDNALYLYVYHISDGRRCGSLFFAPTAKWCVNLNRVKPL